METKLAQAKNKPCNFHINEGSQEDIEDCEFCGYAPEPKVWNCGHTENQHCFADTMFCVRDENWFEDYKAEAIAESEVSQQIEEHYREGGNE